jgi:hypothetical protein
MVLPEVTVSRMGRYLTSAVPNSCSTIAMIGRLGMAPRFRTPENGGICPSIPPDLRVALTSLAPELEYVGLNFAG